MWILEPSPAEAACVGTHWYECLRGGKDFIIHSQWMEEAAFDAHAALPHMKSRRDAVVINVASISGWSPQLAMSGQYGAAKAALIFDTERWALEFVPHRIRVNIVSPGLILVEGNGWDRYRLANPAYSTTTSGMAFRWAVSALPRRLRM